MNFMPWFILIKIIKEQSGLSVYFLVFCTFSNEKVLLIAPKRPKKHIAVSVQF